MSPTLRPSSALDEAMEPEPSPSVVDRFPRLAVQQQQWASAPQEEGRGLGVAGEAAAPSMPAGSPMSPDLAPLADTPPAAPGVPPDFVAAGVATAEAAQAAEPASPASMPPGFQQPLTSDLLSAEISFLKKEQPTRATVAADAAADVRVANAREAAIPRPEAAAVSPQEPVALGQAELSVELSASLPPSVDRPAAEAAAAPSPAAPPARSPAAVGQTPDEGTVKESDALLANVQGMDAELSSLQQQLAELRGEQGRLQQREAQVSKALQKLEAKPPKPLPEIPSESEESSDLDMSASEPESEDRAARQRAEEAQKAAQLAEQQATLAAQQAAAAKAAAGHRGSGRLTGSKRMRLLAAVRAQQECAEVPTAGLKRAMVALEEAVSQAATESACREVLQDSRQKAAEACAEFAPLVPPHLLALDSSGRGGKGSVLVPQREAAFASLDQLPSYQRAFETHERSRVGIQKVLRREFSALLNKHVGLAVQYRQKLQIYQQRRAAAAAAAEACAEFAPGPRSRPRSSRGSRGSRCRPRTRARPARAGAAGTSCAAIMRRSRRWPRCKQSSWSST